MGTTDAAGTARGPLGYLIAQKVIDSLDRRYQGYPLGYWLVFPLCLGPLLMIIMFIGRTLLRRRLSLEVHLYGCLLTPVVYVVLCPLVSWSSRKVYPLLPHENHVLYPLLAAVAGYITYVVVITLVVFRIEPTIQKDLREYQD
jgi:hypothetical protein